MKQTFTKLLRRFAMSEPSVAAARLPVIGWTCCLVGLLPAPKLHSGRPDFDRVDCWALVCSLTDDAPRGLLEATEVIDGFINSRV